MSAAAWTAIGSPVLVALLAYFGYRYTARQGRIASEQSAEVTRQLGLNKDREALVTQLSGQLDKLWPRLDEMDKTMGQQRKRISQLEQRLDDYVHRYRVAIRYVAQLREFIAAHLPTTTAMPEPPEDLSYDLADPIESEDEVPDGWPPPRR